MLKTTLAPDTIVEVFSRHGLTVERIDRFDRGDFAELRIGLPYADQLAVTDLQDLTNRLRLLEAAEKVTLSIRHINMIHRTISLDITCRAEIKTES